MPELQSCPEGFSHEVPSRGLAMKLPVRTLPCPHLGSRRLALRAVLPTMGGGEEAWTTQATATGTMPTSAFRQKAGGTVAPGPGRSHARGSLAERSAYEGVG